jgi:hypothetical protein
VSFKTYFINLGLPDGWTWMWASDQNGYASRSHKAPE